MKFGTLYSPVFAIFLKIILGEYGLECLEVWMELRKLKYSERGGKGRGRGIWKVLISIGAEADWKADFGMKLLFSFQVPLLLVLSWHKFYRKHFEGAPGFYRMRIFF